MSSQPQTEDKPSGLRAGKLLQSGIIFSAISFLTLLIHWVFQFIVSPQLGGTSGEYGLVLATITFIGFLGLPLAIATQAITHYIARFHFSGDDARLHGLLAGCRKFLFHITIAGSVVAIVLVKPLGDFFNIPRTSLTLVALICVLAGLWGSYVTALCQGLGWFKRLALIGLLAAVLRVLSGGITTKISPVAECAVAASGVMLLANFILLFWRKEFPRRTNIIISPWTREFVQFLIVSAAYVIGSNLFIQGDLLVANKFFTKSEIDAYGSAGVLARALATAVGPLLIVLFTHRSSRQHGNAMREQLKLLGLYTVALVSGAICLFVLRGFCLQLLHRDTPDAAAMIGRFSTTMVFVGLLQALGMWSLASRWIKISLLYGGLGVGYWLTLFFLGNSPAALLQTMPIAAGLAFGVLFVVWLAMMRPRKAGESAQS
jgi:O-antigen/teichoic acid export membrane protein